MKRRSLLAPLVVLAALAACGGQEPPANAPIQAPPRKDPASLTQVAETCARIASCTHAHDAPRLRDPSACVDWWVAHADASAPDPLQKCFTQATTCDQITTCIHGGGDARAADFCSKRPGVVSGCDGERLVSCGDDDAQESTVTDCTALGASCREMKSAGGLVIRACFAPQKCPPGAPEARCDGEGAVLSCHDGAIERARCRPGTRCEEHKDESGEATASCTLPGRPRCATLGARRCEGDRLVECSGQDAKVRVSDCAGFGMRCNGTGPRAGCYVPADVECDKEMLPKCADGGQALVFCAAGRLEKISCASLGMATCNPTAHGPAAACSPRESAIPAPAAAK
ncbi:MAG: hypothetical protein JWP87_4115 [Labilithrix sp.]|nr:hypothetical protein [Labilithrix sp.]